MMTKLPFFVAYWSNLYRYIIQGLVTNELADNSYELNLIDAGGSETNATNAFVPEPGTDLAPGSVAMQAGSFLNLAILSSPGRNPAFTQSGIAAIGSLVKCMIDNNCLGDDAAKGFLQCCLLPFAPCSSEFRQVTETVDFEEIGKCFSSSSDMDNPVLNSTIPGVPSNFTQETSDNLLDADRLELVLCLLGALLPPELNDIIEALLKMFEIVFGVVFFVLDILENGLSINIPGELILFVFGWADFEDGEFDAPYKWFYCLFAVGMFLVGIEMFKLFAVTFIVWTKR